MILQLAWKNLWRNRRRSLVVVVAIAFGLWGGLFSGAVMMGLGESVIEGAVNRDLGHLQIHHKNFLREKKIRQKIKDLEQIETFIKTNLPQVAFSPRTVIYAMASSPSSASSVKLCAVDPDRESSVTKIMNYLRHGDFLPGTTLNEIVIGEKLADRLKLKMKSKMVLSFQSPDGEIIYAACRIGGIFKTESAQFDQSQVFMLQRDLFSILGGAPFFHEIAIRCAEANSIDPTTTTISSAFSGMDIRNWKELAPELDFLALTMQSFTYLFVAIILFALLFGITNTMLMSIMDRSREFGILMAIGMRRRRIFSLILLETVLLSLTGGLTGILLGGLTIHYFSREGINLTAVATSLESFGAATMLYPYLPAVMYLTLTVMIIIAANVAALMPAMKAIRLKPAESIRIYT